MLLALCSQLSGVCHRAGEGHAVNGCGRLLSGARSRFYGCRRVALVALLRLGAPPLHESVYGHDAALPKLRISSEGNLAAVSYMEALFRPHGSACISY
jgi:hypothetical protein